MESKKETLKNEKEIKRNEEEKAGRIPASTAEPQDEYQRLKIIEKEQLDVIHMQKISKLRGQIANQELMIEKMRRENEKLKERSRHIVVANRDPELEIALRLSQMGAGMERTRERGLSEAEIDNLPMFALDYETMCSVCKKNIPMDHIVKSLPFCGHIAHQPCIDQWLTTNKLCPECSIPATGE